MESHRTFLAEFLEPRQLLAAVPRVVGYFPEYRYGVFFDTSIPSPPTDTVDWAAVSHLNYFSVSANASGTISTGNINLTHLDNVVAHAHAHNVTVSITVGPQSFSSVNATTFASNIVSFCTTHHLDGIDIDWEPPAGTAVPAYGTLIDALYAQGHPLNLMISAAVNPLTHEIPVAATAKMDWINVMCYDFDYANHSTYAAATSAMAGWNSYGVPKNKLLMGLPFYGRAGTSWSNTVPETYSDILNAYVSRYGSMPPPSTDNAVLSFSGAFGGATATWYWNGPTTVQNKINYVTSNGYGGVMMWELGQDYLAGTSANSNSLLPVIRTSLQPSFAHLDGSGNLIVDGNSTNEAFTLGVSGSNIVVTRGGTPMSFAAASVNAITVNGSGGDDTLDFNGVSGKSVTFNGGGGNDQLNVNAGTFTFFADAQAGNPNLTINVANGANVAFTATQHLAGLNLNGGSAILSAGGGRVLVTRGLTASGGGSLDLGDGALIVDYTGSSPLNTLKALFASGYAGGAWNGSGINSSIAAATPGTAIGYGEAGALFASFPASFAGQSIDASSIVARYTSSGDANLDQAVDTLDFNALAGNFGASGAVWTKGDFNFDGVVDTLDFNALAARFGSTLSSSSPSSLAFAAAGVAPALSLNPFSRDPIGVADASLVELI